MTPPRAIGFGLVIVLVGTLLVIGVVAAILTASIHIFDVGPLVRGL